MINAKTILGAVATYRRIRVSDIVGPSQERHISRPRMEAYWLLRNMTALSLPAIGRYVGGRDHSTILHGITTIQKRADNEALYWSELEEIRILAQLSIEDESDIRSTAPVDLASRVARATLPPDPRDATRLAQAVLALSVIANDLASSDFDARQAAKAVLAGSRGARHA